MNKELTTVEPNSYAILQPDKNAAVQRVMAENVGTDSINQFDLDTVRVPAGGGIAFEVPTLTGPESVKEIEGIIVHWRVVRAYYPGAFTGEGVPPECFSDDGQTGVGKPGGSCYDCPLAQWGSKGRAQACKLRRLLFLVREGDLLPIVVSAPPTSVGPLKKYFLRLASQGKAYYTVVTKLTLEKASNKDGLVFSRVVPAVGKELAPQEVAMLQEYGEALRPALSRVRIDIAAEETE